MNDSPNLANDIFKGISGILWFFYRVFYTMVPTAFFVGLLYITLLNFDNKPDFLNKWLSIFTSSDSGNQVLFCLIIVAFLNVFLEAIVIRIAYRVLGFEAFSAKLFSKFFDQNVSDNLKKLRSPVPFFGLINTYSLSREGKIFEHSQYLLAREFLFNNAWILTLCTTCFIIPFVLFDNQQKTLAFVITVQFAISCLIAKYAMVLVKKTKCKIDFAILTEDQDLIKKYFNCNTDNTNDVDGYFSEKRKKSNHVNHTLAIVTGLALFLIIYPMSCSYSTLLGIDLAAFVLCYFLISAAFREYINVELVIHFYYLINKKKIDKKFS